MLNYLQNFSPDPKRLRQKMVQEQLIARGIKQPAVLAAMSVVPRHLFVDEALRAQAYEDTALPIGFGQTISQPYTVARMSELLEIEKGLRVLEIGTGSGYQAAVLATMGCLVFSLEIVKELYLRTRALFRRLNIKNVYLQRSDGTLGLPSAAPFDRIIVTAGGPTIPSPLLEQLDNDNGILVIPVGIKQRTQQIIRVRKTDGQLQEETLDPVVFVNLVGEHGWRN